MTHLFLAALNGHLPLVGDHGRRRVAEGEFCALECASIARGLPPTEDEARMEHLSRVMVAWGDAPLTPVREAVLLSLTIRRVLPLALRAVGLGPARYPGATRRLRARVVSARVCGDTAPRSGGPPRSRGEGLGKVAAG